MCQGQKQKKQRIKVYLFKYICLRVSRVSKGVRQRNKVSLSYTENVNPCRLTAVECCLVLLLTVIVQLLMCKPQCKPVQS